MGSTGLPHTETPSTTACCLRTQQDALSTPTPSPTTRSTPTQTRGVVLGNGEPPRKNWGTSQCLRHLSTPPPHSGGAGYHDPATKPGWSLLRKEVIQPHLPVRL